MGVLDEAIRDHLELKRRSGVDEHEVARIEAEALGPVRRDRAPSDEAIEASTDADPTWAEEDVDAEALVEGPAEGLTRDPAAGLIDDPAAGLIDDSPARSPADEELDEPEHRGLEPDAGPPPAEGALQRRFRRRRAEPEPPPAETERNGATPANDPGGASRPEPRDLDFDD